MKRFGKYLASLFIAGTLSLGVSQPVRATGYPVVDISNLIQNILGYSDNLIREGSTLMQGVTKMGEIADRVQQAREWIAKAQEIASYIGAASQLAQDIVAFAQLSAEITNDINRFKDLEQQFRSMGVFDQIKTAAYQTLGFARIANMVISQFGAMIQQYTKINEKDPRELLTSVHQTMTLMYQTYYSIRNQFCARYYSCLTDFFRSQNAEAERQFMGFILY